MIDCESITTMRLQLQAVMEQRKNLSTFALTGSGAEIDTGSFLRILSVALDEEKPVVALCIAPVVVALALARKQVAGATMTIGNDRYSQHAMRDLGSRIKVSIGMTVLLMKQIFTVSCPCYMFDARVSEVAAGIDQAAQADMLQGWFCLSHKKTDVAKTSVFLFLSYCLFLNADFVGAFADTAVLVFDFDGETFFNHIVDRINTHAEVGVTVGIRIGLLENSHRTIYRWLCPGRLSGSA